jgi:hypothetical protein
MKFRDVMAHYDYNMMNIAKAVHVTRETVRKWKKKDEVPFDIQCVIQVLSNGVLEANKEDIKC